MTGPGGPRRPFDVVVVPDFLGRHAQVQTGQVLLLLASWLEQYHDRPAPPLHLACLGEPPGSVRELAERAGARISLHEPLRLHPAHHVGNKLRGLEVPTVHNRRLLLDVDTLVLSDLEPLCRLPGQIAVSPDDCPKLSLRLWARIDQHLRLPLPAERLRCLPAELDLPRWPGRWLGYKVPRAERSESYPYFNSGVLLADDEAALRPLWEDNIRRVAEAVPRQPRELPWVHRSDQAGLAVSLQMLRCQAGIDVSRLPDAFHTRWRHLYAGPQASGRVAILHLTTFLHDLPTAPLTLAGLQRAVADYIDRKLARRFARLL
ncbi:MAG: hypothetical protein J5I93_20550, partial [Pirellulaceae bacterium]|nr:hypothetical protein [Pirellulaceae bacterium]